MFNLRIGILTTIIILYVYFIQFSTVDAETIFLDEILYNDSLHNTKHKDTLQFKTGDLILFKASNNINAIVIANYYTHVGIIYVDKGVVKIFEACGIEYMPLKSHHNKKGIFLTPLYNRIAKYKGVVYWKKIDICISDVLCNDFKNFIDYALENMYYKYNIFYNALCKIIGQRYTLGTNCGELVLLSLIKLQLLPIDKFDEKNMHCLKYVSYLNDLVNNKFLPIIKIIDHPFDQ